MNSEAQAEQAAEPQQADLPFAFVQGEAVTEVPKDLYIPPDALEVILESFEGPLDLLLYLIRRENIDILDIPIAAITKQYMEYIDIINEFRLELAAEYLVMAAILAEIKSRMLLPRPQESEESDEDPRAELIRRLQEYERYKKAAEDLDALPRLERDYALVDVEPPEIEYVKPLPEVTLKEMLVAMKEVLLRADHYAHHHIEMEPLSVRERMSLVLESVHDVEYCEFTSLFTITEGRMGVVVTFLAILELVKGGLLSLVQNAPFAPIYLKAPDGTQAD